MNQSLPGVASSRAAGTARRTGRVALGVRRAPDGRSYIARQHATYPFHLCRPHYVAGDPNGMATLYLQSIAGGMFENDRLVMDIVAEEGAALHLTSQGATIVHAMSGGSASLFTSLVAGEDTIVELLPEATILFPGADIRLRTEICAAERAVVCVSESFIAHDPDGGNATFDRFTSDLQFTAPDGRVLVHDRQLGSGAAFRAMSLGRSSSLATYGGVHLWAPHRDNAPLQNEIAGVLGAEDGIYAGVSTLPNDCGLAVRILAIDGAALRATSARVWQTIRQHIFGGLPSLRRK